MAVALPVLWLMGAFSCGATPPVAGSGASLDRQDYVQIRNGKFVLRGHGFVLRGTNYFGSWRFPNTIEQDHGIEQETSWSFYQNWDPHKLDLDFKFLKARLNATALRIGTPAQSDFANLVRYHGYAPWYAPDGTITDIFKRRLVELADLAEADHLRIQLCLLWNIGHEIVEDREAFELGGRMDRFYANQVRSIAAALRDHPGVMAYSVGNEVVVDWPINGLHRSWYEGRAGAFIVRRLQQLRAAAPDQLLTDDEGAAPAVPRWYDPGPDLVGLTDPGGGSPQRSFQLVNSLDYLGAHYYPEKLTPADLPDNRFAAKLADAVKRLDGYMKAVAVTGKPVVINEFGLKLDPLTMPPRDYEKPRDELYRAVVSAAERDGAQGFLAWIALPNLVLRPGDYTVAQSRLNRYSPIEVDTRDPPHRILFCNPSFSLFVWRNHGTTPATTIAATAVAAAWPQVGTAP